MEIQAVKQRLPKRILKRINEEQLTTSLDKLKPPSFAEHPVDSGEDGTGIKLICFDKSTLSCYTSSY